ncbi:beta strand repeat-containing protein [Roseateles sp. LYH14W]|uniref:Beta strand repeat-containing protein n=1 Tax=Pelomonas parva TaxID=3299032 RepID=A0ABW7FA60_9BURK
MTKTAGISRLHRGFRKAGLARLRPVPLALLLAGGLATPASALDYTWLGGTGNWHDSAKWSLLGVPGAGDSATINGSNHVLVLSGTRSLASLFMTNGYLGGSGVLNTGSASFGSAVLGLADTTDGVINVSGNASFNGANNQNLRYGQIVNLNGNTTWSAGNGRIEVDQAYAGNSSTNPYGVSQLNIAAGTTFTDAGAAAAGGTKHIGYNGGQVNNAGTYVRNGLGTTLASYGFNNTGTVQINSGTFGLTGNSSLRGQSSGLINVAAGAVFNLGDADITDGSISNAGLVKMTSSSVATIAAAASINGAWELNHSSAVLQHSGTHSVSSLALTSGYFGGSGVLNTGSASFGSTVLGLADTTDGVINVSGSASFNGANNQNLRYGQIVNLNGNTTWSAGNGRIEVDQVYAGNSSTNPYGVSQLNIAAGTTFTDAGAAAAGGTKHIGYNGGQVNNAGTYVRNGLGTTLASYGFNNTGTVQINSGTFGLTGNSGLRGQSSGLINVAAGAVFNLGDADITDGSINNAGRVAMTSSSVATIAAAASINGAWELNHSSAVLQHSGTHSVSSLALTSGYFGGTGVLNIGSASFGSAVLGLADTTDGVINVSGNASFNGANNQTLRYGQIVNLNGNTTWSAGNGRIEVDQAYAGNSSTNPYGVSQLNIAAGTTFTDAGAAAAGGTKHIGYNGGQVNNAGTYVRNGLGTTLASYGFNNTGTVQINSGTFGLTGNSSFRGQSSGLINVAAGAVFNLGDADITGGSINNAGRVAMTSSSVATIAAAASINGAWELNHSSAVLQHSGTHSVSSLALTSGYFGGTGVLNAGSASFGSAVLGLAGTTDGVINVSGNASFNGANNQNLRYGQIVNLNGNTTWSAGNGRIEVDQAYAGNSSTNPYGVSQLNIAAGTTFTDAGAAAAGGTKHIGYHGGEVNNAGTYVRNGLGTTLASYGFNNTGTVQVHAGTFAVDAHFNNVGEVRIDAGAKLQAQSDSFSNDGLMGGEGTIQTRNLNQALVNAGTLTPGGLGTAGNLLLNGDLSMASGGALRFDLTADAHDLLTITSDVTFGGTLQLWADSALGLHLGDSFVVATYGQRLAGSAFSNVQWLGSGANPFSVEYGDSALTLRVTTAVPEPETWALWLLGVSALAAWRTRRTTRAAA